MKIPSEVVVAKYQDVISVGAYFAPIVKPVRSLVVELRHPDRHWEIHHPLNPPTTARQLAEEKRDHKTRLHALADDISKKFGILRKSFRVRYRMRACQLFIPLWIGEGTKGDVDRLRKIAAYVTGRAKRT